MGSQAFEILRQGVWASLTGGWFYDPHQDVFCNTFHLYLWLFLLCAPFAVYVYFPPTPYVWYGYCASVAIVFFGVKSVNYALHRMYDTTECVREKADEEWSGEKKEEEGIEMDVLNTKQPTTSSGSFLMEYAGGTLAASYTEVGPSVNTDIDSIESEECQKALEAISTKQTSTIDLKAEVHRKNSSDTTSDEGLPPLEPVSYRLGAPDSEAKSQEGGQPLERQNARKHRIEKKSKGNFTNGSLCYIPQVSVHDTELKPTGSLELSYIDKNPNQILTSEGGLYSDFGNRRGRVRRIRSTALETCCPPPILTLHPNSVEIISSGGNINPKNSKNPLPPPSSTLIRNQHLNLCPYYGSEIVYPIAEQSDEHQTSSHGPDTDLESPNHNSDTDYEEIRSPLLLRLRHRNNNNNNNSNNRNFRYDLNRTEDRERVSVTSKDALLDNENSNSNSNSNSSVTPEMQDARTEFPTTDAEMSDGHEENEDKSYECLKAKNRPTDVDNVDRCCIDDNKFLDEDSAPTWTTRTNDGRETGAVRKRLGRRARRRKPNKSQGGSTKAPLGNCSSMVELDLDILFDDGNTRLGRCKGNKEFVRNPDWASTTKVSLEQDVSKVLQETVSRRSARSLGAIPKRSRAAGPPNSAEDASRGGGAPSAKPSEEDPRSSTFLHREQPKAPQAHQALRNAAAAEAGSSVEGLECLVGGGAGDRARGSNVKHRNETYHVESSGGSNNELSSLLPTQALFSAFLASRRDGQGLLGYEGMLQRHAQRFSPPRHCRLRRSARVTRRPPQNPNRPVNSNVGKRLRETAIATTLSSGRGTHRARSFDDTSDGSVHCFRDEFGNWVTYTFDERGHGAANATGLSNVRGGNSITDSGAKVADICDDSLESLSVMLDALKVCNPQLPTRANLRETLAKRSEALNFPGHNPSSASSVAATVAAAHYFEELKELYLIDNNEIDAQPPRNRFRLIQPGDTFENGNYPESKSYYKFKVVPGSFVKVTLDRLKLLALLDRNLTMFEVVISVVLGILVSVLGSYLLYLGFYRDLQSFLFCFVIASCQYSLLKSVQPDASSPTHGFNRIVAYSRPIYFSIFSSIILLINSWIPKVSETEETLLFYSRDFFITFILFFPLYFSLGLFPQIDTFLLYLLEQIDMHLFGGNAISSLSASFYCIFRSSLVVVVTFGLAYGGLCEPKSSQHILFSVFCSCLIASSYHLSRNTSDPSIIWGMVKKNVWPPDIYREHRKNILSKKKKLEKEPKKAEENVEKKEDDEVTVVPEEIEKPNTDPLPEKLQKTVKARLKSDVISCGLIALLVFGVHASSVFTVLQQNLSPIMWCVLAVLGFVLHYIVPQMRKQLPWLCFGRPILRAREYDRHQIRGAAEVMWFEIVYVYLCFFERNILYPIMFLSVLTEESPKLVQKFGIFTGALITVICGLKCLRSTYSNQHFQYLILTFSALFYKYDYSFLRESFLMDYFLMGVVFQKTYELLLKLQFIVTYIAPWQITWGSAFHAFAQPFSVPHSAMLFLQAIVSSILSSPLNPFLGSAIFLTSYVRPVKFWERDYNTKRVDHSNTPLSSHLDRNLGADDNNLNSIFYEHLTRSLQHSLCGDLILGRWGPVDQGDCFVLASDYLNCLVHIIEMGNGLVTFQMRGLEFRGTYCQQREVEAITEGVEENDGCCCCDPGHLPHMLSVNAAFSQRWLAWEVTASKYIIEGYSISDNNAASMFQSFDLRKVLITYYVKSIIFYTIRSPKLADWLAHPQILKGLEPMSEEAFVDLDPVFNPNTDEDYDSSSGGVTRISFFRAYEDWISFCSERNRDSKKDSVDNDPNLVLLCFALSLLGRRSLANASHNTLSTVEFFIYGLHALFKGDFRITCTRDEWIFNDMDLFKSVVSPGVRMSLKLHQDHFMSSEEYEDSGILYEAICKHEEELVITHEGDPEWRNAVLSGTPSLLALRHILDEGSDEYKIIMLNKMYLSFRVIKVNKECVRGLWAGQQQELVYLRNRNPERGSIQNAKQALRNIINSSCDQPIGYPIYVSPLTTSYSETNSQLCELIGGSISLSKIRNRFLEIFRRIRKRCGEGCSSGSVGRDELGMGNEGVYAMTPISTTTTTAQNQGVVVDGRGSSLGRSSLGGGNRGSLGKPTSSTLVSLAGLFKEKEERSVSQAPNGGADERSAEANEDKGNVGGGGEKERERERERERSGDLGKEVLHRVRIEDPNLVYDCINLGRRIDVCWPNEQMRSRGGRSHWRDWLPETGMEGQVVHKWSPYHKDPSRRSHVDRTILLVQIDDKFVPIAESGVRDLGAEV